jgi:hypothetical protein
MRRLFRLVVPVCTLLLAVSVVLDPASYMNLVGAQSAGFVETFDGQPSNPLSYQNPSNWDILISGFNTAEPNVAQHGPNCEAPGFPYTAGNSHLMRTRHDAVFVCNDHVMTAPGLSGYGAVYMTPPALMDFSRGSATLQFDMSTLRTSSRDWVDVVLTPYSQRQLLAFNNVDNHVPPDNIHIMLGGTNVFLVTQRVAGGRDVEVRGDTFTTWDMVMAAQIPPLTQSAARRDRFRVQLTQNQLSVCLMGNETGQTYRYRNQDGFCWVNTTLPNPLDPAVWGNQAAVQIDHRVYNPEKSCSSELDGQSIVHNAYGDLHCPANTWHWDNVSINPAVPFSVIRPTQDFRLTSPSPQTVTFTAPAPPNTHVEFITFGANTQVQLSFNGGQTWQPARLQPATFPGHDEAGEMVWHPVPQGVQSIMVRGNYGFWGGYESSGFNLVSATAGVVRTVPTATATAIAATPLGGAGTQSGSGVATLTPVPVQTVQSVATKTPLPTSSATPPKTPTATASATSSATQTPTVLPGKTLALDGSTGYAEAPNTGTLNLTGNWTVEAWFKETDPVGYAHDFRSLVYKGDGVGGEAPFYIIVGTGNLSAGLKSGGINYRVAYDITRLATNTWHHVAATFDKNTQIVTLYLNGGRVARQTLPRTSTGNSNPLEIGRVGPSGKYWRGGIDDVRIWNVVRTEADIQANYRRTLTAPQTGLVSNWQFNQINGKSVPNLVSSAPAAMLNGSATLTASDNP